MAHHDVFICHASEDKPIADGVCAILEQERIPCWIAPRDILPADDYGKAIVEAIASSRLVVLVFSASANASPHIRRELELAVSRGIPVLPVRVEDVIPSESLQYYLGGIHWLDALTPPIEEHLRHLAGTVRALLERGEPPADAPPAAAAVPAAAATAAGEPSSTPYGPAPTAASSGTPPTEAAPPETPPAAAAPLVGSPPAGPPAAPSGPFTGSPAPPPPKRSGSTLRWVLIALGALALVIVGAAVTFAILFATGGGPAEEAQEGTGTEAEGDSGSDGSLPGPDAGDDELMALSERSCELLDPADVAALYGPDADAGTPAGDGYCDFGNFEAITIFEEPADAASLALYRDVTPGEITEFPDLGGGAFQDEAGTLMVLDEGRNALLLLITGSNTETDRQRLVDLAELIVSG